MMRDKGEDEHKRLSEHVYNRIREMQDEEKKVENESGDTIRRVIGEEYQRLFLSSAESEDKNQATEETETTSLSRNSLRSDDTVSIEGVEEDAEEEASEDENVSRKNNKKKTDKKKQGPRIIVVQGPQRPISQWKSNTQPYTHPSDYLLTTYPNIYGRGPVEPEPSSVANEISSSLSSLDLETIDLRLRFLTVIEERTNMRQTGVQNQPNVINQQGGKQQQTRPNQQQTVQKNEKDTARPGKRKREDSDSKGGISAETLLNILSELIPKRK